MKMATSQNAIINKYPESSELRALTGDKGYSNLVATAYSNFFVFEMFSVLSFHYFDLNFLNL